MEPPASPPNQSSPSGTANPAEDVKPIPIEDIIVDVPAAATSPFNHDLKEKAAHTVAGTIIRIFSVALLGLLLLDFVVIGALLKVYGCNAEQIGEVVTKGVVPLVTSTSTFGSTVFAPLLAFILGYYFSDKKTK